MLYSCRDVTEREHAEEELRAARLDLAHASRLAMVGELMASIAHEINQPLTSIIANAGAGLRRLDADARADQLAELREIFVDIRDQGRQAGDVIERLRALAGKRPLERQALDLNEVASEILRLVGRRRAAPPRRAPHGAGAVAPAGLRRPGVPAAGGVEPAPERHGRDGPGGGARNGS